MDTPRDNPQGLKPVLIVAAPTPIGRGQAGAFAYVAKEAVLHELPAAVRAALALNHPDN